MNNRKKMIVGIASLAGRLVRQELPQRWLTVSSASGLHRGMMQVT